MKRGFRVAVIGGPRDFRRVLGALPSSARLTSRLTTAMAMIIAFAPRTSALELGFARWKRALAMNGSLWICWPKRTSANASDIDENAVRRCALAHGLVDVKVCAIDATWSGLKCVYRLADRT
ncbi:MAG: DUF3052 domain-containing protein [Candidatus Eremiobacteraeota bacterium]|nr:DUF3052 domain-containing protein [Candidatus Eremiobacteraeota bacterium]